MALLAGQQEVLDGGVEAQLVDGATHGVVADVEQVPCAVVEQCDDAAGVDGDHALSDAVQQGLPVVGQACYLGDLQSAGVPLDPTRQQPRRHHAQRGTQPEVHQEPLARAAEQLPRRGIRLADRHDGQDRTVGGQDRHLADQRVRAVDVQITRPGPPLHHQAGPEVDAAAGARRVRRRAHDAVGCDQFDQPGTGQGDGTVEVGGEHAARQRVGVAIADDRRRCEVLGDRDHPLAPDLAELARGLGDRNRRDRNEYHRDHDHLEEQELAGETARGELPARPLAPGGPTPGALTQ